MRVLLTGASGFVGSHVLDRLLARQIPVAVLLRPASSRTFIAEPLARVDVRLGGLDDPASLDAALAGVTHVIHCAGATKALDAAGFFAVNQQGTRNLVAAVNRLPSPLQRFVLISSLAAAGPATADRPKSELDVLLPVSDYGRSKAAAELEVREGCRCDWTILRPPAVYGPRDAEFLRLFRAVQSHLLPRFGGGRQQLTLVYVEDLAAAIVAALTHPNARREIFFAGSPEVVTAAQLAQRIADTSGTWTIPLPLPQAVLWFACQWAGLVSRITRKPNVLNAQKFAELRAPGWVCDVAKLPDRLGCACPTTLAAGVAKTRAWYLAHGWLRA
jgi:nucleoside-diphosphate-sugar epimerase